MRRASLLVIFSFLPIVGLEAEQAALPTYIQGAARTTIANWLAENPNLRLALDEDCGCEKTIQTIRAGTDGWGKPIPAYHPYYTSGDFNNDKSPDIAVVMLETKNSANSTFVIFNGPLEKIENAGPAFMSTKLHGALFFGAPRPEPFRFAEPWRFVRSR